MIKFYSALTIGYIELDHPRSITSIQSTESFREDFQDGTMCVTTV